MKIHIIGGGVIGLCSAWYLQKEGWEVTLIDQHPISNGTSHGNAGMIVPSHFIPLAAPGVIAKGIRWMFNPSSPFYIKPQLDLDLARWLWRFYKSCTAENVQKAMPVLRDYNQLSKLLYKELAGEPGLSYCFEEKGLLMLYRSAKGETEETKVAEQANELGIEARVLSAAQVQALEANIRLDVRGAVFYPGDAHLYPNLFMQQLADKLQQNGATLLTGKQVKGLQAGNGAVQKIILESGEELPAKQIVVAAGSWTAGLVRSIGLQLLLQDGKGYSLTQPKAALRPAFPTLLHEAKVAVTPMGEDLRIGGTLEISHFSQKVNARRLEGILKSIPQYYPDLKIQPPKLNQIWQGYRPCSPDGLPYLGRSKRYNNVTIATGHAMMGMSLGPATGKLVSEIVTGKSTTVPIELFSPERFS